MSEDNNFEIVENREEKLQVPKYEDNRKTT